MNRKDSRQSEPKGAKARPTLFCDLTQSWSERGGGVRTYLMRKRQHIIDRTPHRHLLIIPGADDAVSEEGRAITVTVKSPHVPGSPNYRLLLRNRAVRETLERFAPDFIECEDAYNLPWAAIGYRRRHPATVLTAVYMTDFPTVYVERPLGKVIGPLARPLARLGYAYCGRLYRQFDRVMALGEHGGAARLRALGIDRVDAIGLGVDLADFGPHQRDPALRRELGLGERDPLIIYVGRLDREKRPQVVVEAFRQLPRDLGARLVLIGDGPLRPSIERLDDDRIILPGFLSSRTELARWLASADLYASGMADETFGISVVEAQASGLPVVGVGAGAMHDRVTEGLGLLGPVDDSTAMARNIEAMLATDRPATAERAIAEAATHSWDHVMTRLFDDFYPRARSYRLGDH